MYLLDRVMIRSYLKAYLICLVSLLTLYVIIDMFTNLEDFANQSKNLSSLLKHIGIWYSFQISLIFNRLSEVIALLAATFTVALMQRSNELLPLLSAGVSTRRVVRPVLACACLMLGLGVANQELIVSRFGNHLQNSREDPASEGKILVPGVFAANGVHIHGTYALRKHLVVKEFHVTIPEKLAGCSLHLDAQEARYVPPREDQRYSDGWLLSGTKPEQLENWNHPDLEMLDPGKYFLRAPRADFDAVTRSLKWYVHASTYRLWQELNQSDSPQLAPMAVQFHMRLTRPLLGVILVLLGLSIILRDQNRNVFISAGLCVALCALFFAAQYACKSLGDSGILSPALAAWTPVLIFGPFSWVMFDAVHT